MICLNCQKENADGSRFCQFCGAPLSAPAEEPVTQAVIQEIIVPAEEPVMEAIPEKTPESVAVQVSEEMPAKVKKPVFLIVVSALMSLLFFASAGLNVYQYFAQKYLNEKYESSIAVLMTENKKNAQALRNANDTIDYLRESIAEMTAAMNKEAVTINAYERLVTSLEACEWGYFSDEFYTDYYLVYLAPGEEFNVTLYTQWEGTGSVTVSADSEYATASFTEESWLEETKVLLTGVKEGMTLVTFTWDHEKSFDIVVFVEE
jgi:hypothetical protein